MGSRSCRGSVSHWDFPRERHSSPPPPRLLVILLLAIVEFSGFIKGKHFYVVSWGGKKILRHIFM